LCTVLENERCVVLQTVVNKYDLLQVQSNFRSSFTTQNLLMLTFFNLADEQQADILVNWLCVADVSKLDTAMCNKALRFDFLDMLYSKCIFHDLDTCIDPLRWAIRNSLKFRKASLKHTECKDRDVMDAIGPMLESLVVIYCPPDEDEDGPSIPHHRYDNNSFLVMEALRHACKNLKYLRIHNFEICTSFYRVIRLNQLLEEVDLHNCTNLHDSTVRVCIDSPLLHTLSISYSFKPASGPRNFGSSANLRTLKAWDTNLTGEECALLCSAFPNLTDLKISLPDANTDLVQIAHSCVHLQKAQFLVSHTISDHELTEMAACWKAIQWLYVGHSGSVEEVCSERAVLGLLRACPTLKRFKNCIDDPSAWILDCDMPFSVDACHYDVKNALVRDEPKLSGLYQLTHLFVDSLSEHGLTSILEMCPHLHTLAIRHRVDYAPVAGVEYTADTRPAEFALQHINDSSVRTLHIVNCSTLNDSHVSVIRTLSELVICDAGTDLTNSAVLAAANACVNLTSLKLCRCTGLTCSVVLPILKKCALLRRSTTTPTMLSGSVTESKPWRSRCCMKW